MSEETKPAKAKPAVKEKVKRATKNWAGAWGSVKTGDPLTREIKAAIEADSKRREKIGIGPVRIDLMFS